MIPHKKEEHSFLIRSLSRLLRENFQNHFVRSSEFLRYDDKLWKLLIDLDAPGLRVKKSHGGMACELVDAARIAFEAGYFMAPAPLLESIVAAKLLSDIGRGVALDWFDQIMSGQSIVSIAVLPTSIASRQTIPSGKIADAVIAFDGYELAIFTATTEQRQSREKINLKSTPEWIFKKTKYEFLTDGRKAKMAYDIAIEELKILQMAKNSGIRARSMDYAAERNNTREIGAIATTISPLSTTEFAPSDKSEKLLFDSNIIKFKSGKSGY